MAVPTTALAIRYEGNGSTVTAYPIPFPFLDVSHIYAAVSVDGVATPVLLPPSSYSVARLVDGSGGSLTTAAAVEDPAELVIFRQVPLTQPTEFQANGPFRAQSAETALDRLLMQIQQLARRVNELEGTADEDYIYVPGGDPDASQGVLIWEDATARAAVKPAAAGQLGAEISTQTVWIAQSSAVGDWAQFRPKYSNKLVIGLASDTWGSNAITNAAANVFRTIDVDAVLLAGDNNGHGLASFDADWADFASFISSAKAFPALGNLDVDEVGWEEARAEKFPYLPGNKRYYSVVLGGGLVEVFVLNSGFDSLRDLVEPDGNEVGSVQHAWFVDAVKRSTARWRVAMFHHPPVSLNPAEEQIAPEMAWPELAQMDLIFCGHTHLLEVVKWNDTMLVNISAMAVIDGTAGAVLQGGTSLRDWPLWADDVGYGYGLLVATHNRLDIEIRRTSQFVTYARSYDDFSPRPVTAERFTVIDPATTVGLVTDVYAGVLTAATRVLQVAVSVAEPGTLATWWTVKAGEEIIASGTLAAGATFMKKTSLVASEMIPEGTQLTFSSSAMYAPDSDAKGLEVVLYGQRWF